MQQQYAAGREVDVGAAGGAVGDGVPQVGQYTAVASGASGSKTSRHRAPVSYQPL